ncbi:MAG TPA: DsbA family protein [Gemmatimonadaceae bacterium]|nr:DsbA family protein [Gemmatimonadaceae bacterium]
MANKRVEPGRGRKSGVVSAAKKKPAATTRAFYLIIAVIAVAGIAALTYASTRPKETALVDPIDTTLAPVQSSGYVLGSATAPIEVTEFGDFECPACGSFANLTEPDIRKNYVNTGKVRWRFIDFPLNVHRNTWQASRAAACADEQGRFWDFHDLLYQTQDQWSSETTDNPDKVMKQLGRQLGLKTGQFDQCVDTKKYQAKIQAHLKLAELRKIMQTPTFILGTEQIVGGRPYDDFAKILDSALAAAPKTPAPSSIGGDTAAHPAVGGKKPGT